MSRPMKAGDLVVVTAWSHEAGEELCMLTGNRIEDLNYEGTLCEVVSPTHGTRWVNVRYILEVDDVS